jgi:hypothetical protein
MENLRRELSGWTVNSPGDLLARVPRTGMFFDNRSKLATQDEYHASCSGQTST